MQIVDSHCHIDRVDLNAFGGSIESMLKHAGDSFSRLSFFVFVLI